MQIELRHLRYFVAVAEELHFGRAAARVGIAQPPLSQQIRKLERELGVELFERTRRRVALSAAGEAMLPMARRALGDAQAAAEAARRAGRGEIGALAVGFIESAAGSVVPSAVRRFRDSHPDVRLDLREMSVDAQIAALQSGRLDIAVVRPPIAPAGLRLERVSEEPLVVAAPEAHPIAARSRVATRTLAGQPLVLLSREAVPGLHDRIVALHREHGIEAAVAQEATSIQAVLGLVAAGLGISLLPRSVCALQRAGVAFVTLSSSPRLELLAATRDEPDSPLRAAFREELRRSGRETVRGAGPGRPSARSRRRSGGSRCRR